MVAEGCWLSFSENFLLWLLVTVAHSLHGRPLLVCKHNASQSCKPESIQSNVYFEVRRSLFLSYDTLFRVSLAPVYFRANCGNLLATKIISNQAGNAHFFPSNQWLHWYVWIYRNRFQSNYHQPPATTCQPVREHNNFLIVVRWLSTVL